MCSSSVKLVPSSATEGKEAAYAGMSVPTSNLTQGVVQKETSADHDDTAWGF